ncbi:MAG TPA: Ppx/GppA phosphatase family protein [Beutenbergiaceae bacterium]|nr:Ppx/GppA phosphatase family protein [Beutenbergiaceae bacterium]
MKRVAAIDCGTNSIRLLIADVDAAGTNLREVTRLMEIVRLGQGVDRTGQFHPEALARTLEATSRYAQLCRDHGVQAVRFVATSASRDASNREEFFAGVRDRLGVEVEIITGSQEAALSFMGATSVLPDGDDAGGQGMSDGVGAAGREAPDHKTSDRDGATGRAGVGRLVVDIGGGSTELVLGTGRTLQADTSMNIGCVRMAERHLVSDPPSPEEISRARTDIDAALDEAEREVRLSQVRTVVGVAGSVTTVTAHALGLPEYDRARINGTRLPLARVHEACTDLLHMPRHQRAELPYMHPGRVDVIGAGALVWTAVLDRIDNRVRAAGSTLGPIVTSEHDILDGIALSMG